MYVYIHVWTRTAHMRAHLSTRTNTNLHTHIHTHKLKHTYIRTYVPGYITFFPVSVWHFVWVMDFPFIFLLYKTRKSILRLPPWEAEYGGGVWRRSIFVPHNGVVQIPFLKEKLGPWIDTQPTKPPCMSWWKNNIIPCKNNLNLILGSFSGLI